jgi:hypothetical protein
MTLKQRISTDYLWLFALYLRIFVDDFYPRITLITTDYLRSFALHLRIFVDDLYG